MNESAREGALVVSNANSCRHGWFSPWHEHPLGDASRHTVTGGDHAMPAGRGGVRPRDDAGVDARLLSRGPVLCTTVAKRSGPGRSSSLRGTSLEGQLVQLGGLDVDQSSRDALESVGRAHVAPRRRRKGERDRQQPSRADLRGLLGQLFPDEHALDQRIRGREAVDTEDANV